MGLQDLPIAAPRTADIRRRATRQLSPSRSRRLVPRPAFEDRTEGRETGGRRSPADRPAPRLARSGPHLEQAGVPDDDADGPRSGQTAAPRRRCSRG